MKKDVKKWTSTTITQFELAKIVYTSGFLAKINVTAAAKLVLMALIQHYNANNAEMFPSQKFLAHQLGISEKSVERAIANLRDEKLIDYVTKKVNRYRFTAFFFDLLKMSVQLRQNVGSHVRQNVGETNNSEKIKKKEDFLNLQRGEESRDLPNPERRANALKQTVLGEGKNVFENDEGKRNSKNAGVSSAAQILKDMKNFALQSPQSIEKQVLAPSYTDGREEETALKTAFNKGENACYTCDEQGEDDDERTPSMWSRQEALAWITKLSPVFRTRGLSKMLIEKFDFSREELFADSLYLEKSVI